MLKKTITYKDLDGKSVTEDFYFNLSKAELMEKEVGSNGEYSKTLQTIASSKDGSVVIPAFKDILSWAYGRRSSNGKSFIKNPEFFKEFEDSDAYSELIMELFTDSDAAASFVNGLMPEGLERASGVKDAFAANTQTDSERARAASQAALQGHKQAAPVEPETVVLPSPPVESAPQQEQASPPVQAQPYIPPFVPDNGAAGAQQGGIEQVQENPTVPDYSSLTDDQLRELPIDQITRKEPETTPAVTVEEAERLHQEEIRRRDSRHDGGSQQ